MSLLLSLEDCLGAPLQLMVAARKEKCWRVIICFLGGREWGWVWGFCGSGCGDPPRIGRLIVIMGVGMWLKKVMGWRGK